MGGWAGGQRLAVPLSPKRLPCHSAAGNTPAHAPPVPAGYQRLAEHLARGLDIRLGMKVTRVEAPVSPAARVAVTAVDAKGATRVFSARRVVLAVPVGVLKAGAIELAPPLPRANAAALASLGSGLLNKVRPGMQARASFAAAVGLCCCWDAPLASLGSGLLDTVRPALGRRQEQAGCLDCDVRCGFSGRQRPRPRSPPRPPPRHPLARASLPPQTDRAPAAPAPPPPTPQLALLFPTGPGGSVFWGSKALEVINRVDEGMRGAWSETYSLLPVTGARAGAAGRRRRVRRAARSATGRRRRRRKAAGWRARAPCSARHVLSKE